MAHHRQEVGFRLGRQLRRAAGSPQLLHGAALAGEQARQRPGQAEDNGSQQAPHNADFECGLPPLRQKFVIEHHEGDQQRIFMHPPRGHDAQALVGRVGQTRAGRQRSAAIGGVAERQAHRRLAAEGLAEFFRDGRIARNQYSVIAQQLKHLAAAAADGLVEIGEKFDMQPGKRQTEHLAGFAADFAAEVKGPRTRAAILYGSAEIDLQFRVGAMRQEIVTITEVDRLAAGAIGQRRPPAREVQHLAAIVDDGGDIDLRHAAGALADFLVDIRAGHGPGEAGLVIDADLLHALGNRPQHQVGGFDGLPGLFGQHLRVAGGPGHGLVDGSLPGEPDNRPSGAEHHGRHQGAGEEHRPAWAEAARQLGGVGYGFGHCAPQFITAVRRHGTTWLT